MPRATSRATEPVGMTSIGARTSSPRRMTEPLPNCLSICARAVSSALSRSAGAGMVLTSEIAVGPADRWSVVVEATLGGTTDSGRRRPKAVDGENVRPSLWRTLAEQMFDTVDDAAACRRDDPRALSPRGAPVLRVTTPATLGRNLHRVAQRQPHLARARPGGQGLLGRAPAEDVDDHVPSDRARVRGAELVVQQLPELAVPHVVEDRTPVRARRPPRDCRWCLAASSAWTR